MLSKLFKLYQDVLFIIHELTRSPAHSHTAPSRVCEWPSTHAHSHLLHTPTTTISCFITHASFCCDSTVCWFKLFRYRFYQGNILGHWLTDQSALWTQYLCICWLFCLEAGVNNYFTTCLNYHYSLRTTIWAPPTVSLAELQSSSVEWDLLKCLHNIHYCWLMSKV